MQNNAQQIPVQHTRAAAKSYAAQDSLDTLFKEALEVSNPFTAANPLDSELKITKKQIEILEDAIARYERLEDIKKFSNLVLEEVENVSEEDIKRALEAEKQISIEDEKAVLELLNNEGFMGNFSDFDPW